jgi:hypothetical protein
MIAYKKLLSIVLLVNICGVSCGILKSGDYRKYKKANIIITMSWGGKFDDNFIQLKDHHFFTYYKKFVGLLKKEESYGSYKLNNTTLVFSKNLIFKENDIWGTGYIDTVKNNFYFTRKDSSNAEIYNFKKDDIQKLLTVNK